MPSSGTADAEGTPITGMRPSGRLSQASTFTWSCPWITSSAPTSDKTRRKAEASTRRLSTEERGA